MAGVALMELGMHIGMSTGGSASRYVPRACLLPALLAALWKKRPRLLEQKHAVPRSGLVGSLCISLYATICTPRTAQDFEAPAKKSREPAHTLLPAIPAVRPQPMTCTPTLLPLLPGLHKSHQHTGQLRLHRGRPPCRWHCQQYE
jgi:hypothetical protein